MRTMCSREIFTKKFRQQQIFDSDLKGAWHYSHVTFTPITKDFMLYCRSIYMLSILYVRVTIKVKAGIPASFKVGCYPRKKTGSSHQMRVTLSLKGDLFFPLLFSKTKNYMHNKWVRLYGNHAGKPNKLWGSDLR